MDIYVLDMLINLCIKIIFKLFIILGDIVCPEYCSKICTLFRWQTQNLELH